MPQVSGCSNCYTTMHYPRSDRVTDGLASDAEPSLASQIPNRTQATQPVTVEGKLQELGALLPAPRLGWLSTIEA